MNEIKFQCKKCVGTGEGFSGRLCIYCDGMGFVTREVEDTEDRMLRGARLARQRASKIGRKVARTALPDHLVDRLNST